MKKQRTNPDFHNGVPELLILQLLARRPMHGYDLVKAIHRETGGTLAFGEGCIYPILHRLEAQKQLDCEEIEIRARIRRVYRVTASGKKQLAASVSAWRRVAQAVAQVLEGGADVQVEPA